jgi:hypothetical protein
MPDYTRVEVEASANSPMSAYQVYRNSGEPFPIERVRIYEGGPQARLYAVTGWSSEDGGRPARCFAVRIEDSSEGTAYLVYGADWGIRLAPAGGSPHWDVDAPDQWGETHLVLADRADIDPA